MILRIIFVFAFVISSITGHAQEAQVKVRHVILISFDGLRSDAIKVLGPEKAETFNQMIKEGVSTLNARTDYDYTVTLPNHTCMITGYPVKGPQGHHLTENILVNKTIHDFAGRHVYSIFDSLHKNNYSSAMLASKLKFNIYKHSFPIDFVSLTDQDDLKTLHVFQKLIRDGLPNFVFMHFSGADHMGHQKGWSVDLNSSYMKEVQILNGYLESVLKEINSNTGLKDSTVIIVTTDHGGEGLGHSDNKKPLDYTIPFIIWGKAVAKGADLYRINRDRRQDPSDKRITYSEKSQPIRNGDAANLALSLLGLPPVEGSTIGYQKPLKINED